MADLFPRNALAGGSGKSHRMDLYEQNQLGREFISSFGEDAAEATAQGLREPTPENVRNAAWSYLTTGPMGPFGSIRIPNPIRAYHGSPHDFDEFRLDRIGTGEGAQAYGHGLYFAENPDVARSYRMANEVGEWRVGDQPYNPTNPEHFASDFLDSLTSRGLSDRAAAAAHARRFANELGEAHPSTSRYHEVARLLESGAPLPSVNRGGRMYEVNLHARPEQFLDWDRPLSGQSGPVRENIDRVLSQARGRPVDESFYGSFGESGSGLYNLTSAWTRHHPDSTAGALREAGIPGIRYLDQGSRGAGQGTSNYVVFSPELIEILRKYGMAGPVAGGIMANALAGDDGGHY